MTWTLTQKSPQATSITGSITPTFSGGTTAGNLLVAVLVSSGAGTWTLPAGWVQGPGVTNSANHSEIWYYVGNPGSITSVACSYSNGSANSKGALAEFHTDVAGATVVPNAQGTGTAGTVATCNVSTGTGAASGDLTVGTWLEHFSTSTAVTWTDPGGFTQIVSDGASAGNHQYSAYDLSVGSGTLSVTATSNTASDLASGWSGVVQTFTAQTGAPATGVWSLTQKSASQATGSTSVTGTLPASSGGTAARPRLVTACLIATGGGGSWNALPAGWALGPDIMNGGYIRATIAYFIDTGSAHVGTTTVFTYSVTGSNVKCIMAEYDPGVDGVTISASSTGTGLAGAVSSCTVTSGTVVINAALALCCFAEHFTSSTAVTWTDPSGWTLVGDDTASGGNHQYVAHDLSAAAGSLSVTGKTNVATTSSNGWAGALATFVATTGAVGGGITCGAFINPNMYSGGLTLAQAISKWETNSNRRMAARRSYWGLSSFPGTNVSSDMKADAAAGRITYVSFKPNPSGNTTDLSSLNSSLSTMYNYVGPNGEKVNAHVILWHEPYYQNLTVTQYQTMIRYYGPTVRQYFPLVFTTGLSSVYKASENSYYISGAFDEVTTDYYDPAVKIGAKLGVGGWKDPAYWADVDGLPFGVTELGCTTDPTTGQWWSETKSQNLAFFNNVQTYFANRLALGRPCSCILWFNSTQPAWLYQITPIIGPDGASDPYSPGNTEYRNFYWDQLADLAPSSVPSITTGDLPGGTVGTSYSQTLSVTGGTAPYVWSRISGSLPAGLTLSSAGTISGTPTTIGASSFTVQVADAMGQTATQALSITIAAAVIAITTTSLPGASTGTAYSYSLVASGGTTPYTWSVYTGLLPDGLTLSSGGVISGTPTASGTFNFTVQVTDATSKVDTQVLSIIVSGTLTIVTTGVPDPQQGVPYNQQLIATGGIPPYFWSVTSGSLPAGLALSSSGVISGTPTTTGSVSVGITVTDSG